MTTNARLFNGDCLDVMKGLPAASVDLILCDLPYGITDSRWDSVIPMGPLWAEYERIIKDRGAVVLFASGRFTFKLMQSNEALYRYKWIWYKSKRGNFVNAKNRPMTSYEEVLVFSKAVTANGCKNKMVYNPQGLVPKHTVRTDKSGTRFGNICGHRPSHKETVVSEWTNYPHDVLEFASQPKPVHPTQKPVPLLEYLVRTYTDEGSGAVVLDNAMGSGSTGVACANTGRDFIGIELEPKYYEIARDRIAEAGAEIEEKEAGICQTN